MDKYIEARIKLEKRVIKAFATRVFAAGLSIEVSCEGEIVGRKDLHTKADKDFIDDCTCADMIELEVYTPERKHIGTALLVLGNDGYDAIADHHVNLSKYMPSDHEMDMFERKAESNRKLLSR